MLLVRSSISRLLRTMAAQVSFILASRFQSCAFFHERTCARHPVGSSWNYGARWLSTLFFFILSPFSLPLIRLHRKSELPFVCNGESRKGEGARSTAREKKEWKRSRRRGRMGEGFGEWRGNKGRRREGRCRETAAHPSLFSRLLSLSPFFLSISFYFTLLRISFSLLPAAAFLTLNLFRASTIYLQASNKKK